jgi:hypothetical protein
VSKKSIILIPLVLLLFVSMACVLEENNSSAREISVSTRLEQIRDNPQELRAFFLAMPKGGDIHNHLTGAVYAEGLIDRASSEGKSVFLNNCSFPSNPTANETVPVSQAYRDPKLYDCLVDSWSMKDQEFLNVSGHDHFFGTFSCFGGATSNTSALVAELRNRAALENVEYLELMTSAGGGSDASNLSNNLSWNNNLTLNENMNSSYENLKSRGLRNVAKKASDYLNKSNYESIQISADMVKAGFVKDTGKNVTVKYLYSASRTKPKEQVFTQLALAFEVAEISPLVVGVNLLAAEDNLTAREDYSKQMEMVKFLHEKYPDVKIALHAGELTLGLVPPEDLRFHIREAVEIGNASRIGHGVDIMSELNSAETLKCMAEKGVCIEIMPVSNEEILGVQGESHPFPIYLSRKVPITLASDDAGVLRTDLTEQFVIIAHTYPQVKYSDFKKFVRNSMEYSFLDGDGIWLERGVYVVFRPELEGCDILKGDLTQTGKKFLYENEKAREEWRLEGKLADFEQKLG